VANKDSDANCAACDAPNPNKKVEEFKFNSLGGGFSLGSNSGAAETFTFGAPVDFKFQPFDSAAAATPGTDAVADLQQKLAASEEEKAKLKRDIEELKNSHAEEEGWVKINAHDIVLPKVDSGNEELAALRERVSKQDTEAKELKEKLNSLEAEQRSQSQLVSKLQREKEEYLVDKKKGEKDSEDVRNQRELEQALAEVKSAKSQLAETRRSNESDQAQVKELQQQLKELSLRIPASKHPTTPNYGLLALVAAAAAVIGAIFWPLLSK